jgi:hypothetical protein
MRFEALLATATDLDAFGGAGAAVREAVRRMQVELAAWWDEPLDMQAAAKWGGYSPSRLRGLVHEGTIPVAPGGGIRRRHVPVRPGHVLPVPSPVEGAIPAPVVPSDFVTDLREHRQRRSSR